MWPELLDLFSRKIVGWDMSSQIDATLVERALRMALYLRQPGKGLLHHSDRGVQYASHQIRNILAANQIQVSMSGKGNCYDNTVISEALNTALLAAQPAFCVGGFIALKGNRCSCEGVMPRLLAAGIAEARLPILY